MIVCICRRISDRDIARHARAGMGFDEIQFELGVATQCGQCEGCARDVINQCSGTCPDSQHPASQPPSGRPPMEFVTSLTTSLLTAGLNVKFIPVAALPFSLVLVAGFAWWILRRK